MHIPFLSPLNTMWTARAAIMQAQANAVNQRMRHADTLESMSASWRLAEETFLTGMGKVERDIDDMQRSVFLQHAMRASVEDGFVRNGLRNQVNYVVGTGSVIQTENEAALDQWTAWKKANGWDATEKEIERRAARDGDAFIRHFAFGPSMDIRFIDSEAIVEPISPPFAANWSGGIATLPEDVQTVLGYWVLRDTADSNSGEFVPAEEVTHYGFERESTAKFGTAILRAVLKTAKQLDIEETYQHEALRLRLAIALTEKLHAAPSDITSGGIGADQSTRRTTNANYVKAFKPGTILTRNEGVEHAFISPNLDGGDVTGFFAYRGRKIAAAFGQPEYMVTADASNNNRAGSIVAGSPFFKAVSSERDSLGPVILAIYERVTGDTGASVTWKRLDAGGLAEDLKALAPYRLNGDISRTGILERADFDPDVEQERLDQEEDESGANEEDFQISRERDAGDDSEDEE